jgi:hypothetical protein
MGQFHGPHGRVFQGSPECQVEERFLAFSIQVNGTGRHLRKLGDVGEASSGKSMIYKGFRRGIGNTIESVVGAFAWHWY